MRFGNRGPLFILVMLLALPASGIMLYLADDNLACGWTNNVVRNWEQYGLWRLKGKLVMNPGGYEALTRPEVYKGHRAAFLYPVFLIKRLFAWTGAGTLAYHIALSLTLLFSTWFLLGKSRIGWLAGAAAILCPGTHGINRFCVQWQTLCCWACRYARDLFCRCSASLLCRQRLWRRCFSRSQPIPCLTGPRCLCMGCCWPISWRPGKSRNAGGRCTSP